MRNGSCIACWSSSTPVAIRWGYLWQREPLHAIPFSSLREYSSISARDPEQASPQVSCSPVAMPLSLPGGLRDAMEWTNGLIAFSRSVLLVNSEASAIIYHVCMGMFVNLYGCISRPFNAVSRPALSVHEKKGVCAPGD